MIVKDEIQNLVIDISAIDVVYMNKAPESKTVKPTTEEQVVTPSERHELTKVIVKAIQTEEKHIIPTVEKQTFVHEEDVYYSTIEVDGVSSNIDDNIKPENIREGVSILDVVGTMKPDKPDQVKIIQPSSEQQEATADEGFDLQKVIVEAIQTEEKYITPTAEKQTFIPGKDIYYSKIEIEAASSSIDDNIKPENIREGTKILDVVGTMKPDKPDQIKSVKPSIYEQEVSADTGYDLQKVIVEAIEKEPGMAKFHIQQIDLGNGECEIRLTSYNGESDDNFYVADFFDGDIMSLSAVSPYLLNRGGK